MNDENVGVPGDGETYPFELEPQASASRGDEDRDLLWPGPLPWRVAAVVPLARLAAVLTPSIALTPPLRRGGL